MRSSKVLTKTEKLVSDKILLGFSRQHIADIFECCPEQITRIMSHVYHKTDVSNREEFMAKRIAYLEDMLHKNRIHYEEG